MSDEERDVDAMHPLVIDVRSSNGETHLTLVGDVDVSSEIDLRAEADAIRELAPDRLTIDLRDVGFIDVRGAASLAALIRIARASGAEVDVVVPPKIRATLDKIRGDDRRAD